MIPLQKVKDIIDKHNILEKELSSGKVDPKLFAKKSKEYSNLGRIILVAKKPIKKILTNISVKYFDINKNSK